MTIKNELLKQAKELGLDATIKWTKREIQEAIDHAEAEIAKLEEDKTEDDTAKITPKSVAPVAPAPIAPVPVAPTPATKPVPAPAPEPVGDNLYKCLCNVCGPDGKTYEINETIELDDDRAKVLKSLGAIGPVDKVQAVADRKQILPAGEYVLTCDLIGKDKVHKAGETITCTLEEADLYESIGAIAAK